MKLILILLAAILLNSCSGSSQQTRKQNAAEENWQTARVTTQNNSYNKSGLLDTTYKIENIYVRGVPGFAMNFFVTRNYDHRNNKTSERTFQIFKKRNELFEEVLYEYDAKNNLIIAIDKIDSVINKIIKNTYNDKDQRTEEMRVLKKFDEHSDGWNLDSAFAHRNDKKNPQYDTSIITYQYDSKGNLVSQIYKNSNREIGETVTTLFSGKQKTLSFGISPNGDTVSITNYERKGNLVTQIDHDKKNSLYIDTSLYDRDKLIQEIFIDKRMNFNRKEIYKYDDKGNEVQNISYK